jgi:hypothetical protein
MPAAILLLDHVNNPYVIVIALNFLKGFDTAWQAALAEKLASLNSPDHVYNWLCNFLIEHSHSAEHNGETSAQLEITANIIQSSAVGPMAYIVTAADLRTVGSGKVTCKYAYDT